MNMICNNRFHIFLIAFAISFLFSYATDTIHTSQVLSDISNVSLISSTGSFALGFFSLGSSKNRYVGIWYNNIQERTIVWVANGEVPLTDRSGVLKVAQPGVLVLLNATNAIIWSTKAHSQNQSQNLVAQLLDSGNLVVRDADDEKRPENFIWQSFDYPTDTLLPGMKLGKNFVTGHDVFLSSPKSIDDPEPGNFTYHCDPTGYPQNVIKRGASFRYKTGPWNGLRFSGSTKNTVKNTLFDFGMVINENEVYYYNNVLNNSHYTRLTISESGEGYRWVWSYESQKWEVFLTFPRNICDDYNACGAYGVCTSTNASLDCMCLDKFKPNKGDFSYGCILRTPLSCLEGDGFLKYSGMKLPDTESSWYNASMNLEECEVECSRNCSCTAFSSLDISNGESGCLLWFGDLLNMRKLSPGQDIHIRVAKSELDSGIGKRRILIIVILPSVIGIMVLGLSLVLCYQKRKNLKQQGTERRKNYDESHKEVEIPMYDLSTIFKVTDNFSLDNKLGEGGFGPVYKGVMEGQEIAVKRLSTISLQGGDEFMNEVSCIAKLQHRNLVRILGCCIQGEEKILVYEYMTNKSLDFILFDEIKRVKLDWTRRFDIINGIARGLMYLHQDSHLRVIHRDLKASNILLDFDMIPKISDFGLARTLGGNETGAKTRRVVGTYGYMSPEYAIDGMFSVKSDVFSFGVLVLEIISGKRNRGFSLGDHNHNLLGHAWMLYKEERSVELIDSCMGCSNNVSEIVRSIHVGLLCVQEHVEERPNMSSVVQMLNNEGVLPLAKHPGFFVGRDIIGVETSKSSNTASSDNVVTISLLEAR